MKIAVFGAGGVMAKGIIEVLLTHTECEVAAFDIVFGDEFKLRAAQTALKSSLCRAGKHEKKLIYRSRKEILAAFSRVAWLTPESRNLAAYLHNCDASIEAIIENEGVKKALYALIEQSANPDMPIFTNTSTITVGRLAGGMKYPERFMALHFFNPVPIMKPIEAILNQSTSAKTIFEAEKIAKVLCKKMLFAPDTPGFVVNGAYVPAIKVVLGEVEAGASYEEIDKACTTGRWVNFPPARKFVETLINESVALLAKYKADPRLNHFSEEQAKETIEELMKLGTNMPAGPFELKELLDSGRAEEILKDPESTEKYKLYLAMGPMRFIDLVGIDVALDCVKSIAAQKPGRGWTEPKILVEMKKAGKLGVNKGGVGFYTHGPQVRIEYPEDGYAKIVFKNGQRNPLSMELIKKIRAAFAELKTKPNLKAVFLQGSNGNFATGADINEFPLCLIDEGARKSAINEGRLLLNQIMYFPAPVIAVVETFALGGGYEIPLVCDLIIGYGKVGLPEKGLGILPGWLGTQTLARRAGLEKALWMTLGAEIVEASFPWIDIPLKKGELTWAKLKAIADGVGKRKFEPLRYNMAQTVMYWSSVLNLWIKVRLGKEPASALLALQTIWQGTTQKLIIGAGIEWNAILKAFAGADAEKGIMHFIETGKHLYKPEKK